MFRFLIAFLLLSTPALAGPNYYDYRIRRVVDGDTVEIVVPYLPPELGHFLKLRIYGVDTPEKGFRAQCSIEGTKAENRIKTLEGLNAVRIKEGQPPFSLADVGLNANGEFTTRGAVTQSQVTPPAPAAPPAAAPAATPAAPGAPVAPGPGPAPADAGLR